MTTTKAAGWQMRNWGDAAKADLTAGRTTAWTKGTTTTKLPVFLPDRWKFLWQSRMLEYCADHQSLHFPFLVLFSPLSSPPPFFGGRGGGLVGGGGRLRVCAVPFYSCLTFTLSIEIWFLLSRISVLLNRSYMGSKESVSDFKNVIVAAPFKACALFYVPYIFELFGEMA